MGFYEKLALATVISGAIGFVLLLAVPMSPEEAAAAAAARDRLPPGAVLIYLNDHNDNAKRTIKIGDCYFTEVWDRGDWALMNDGDGVVAVQCVGP